MKAAAVSILIGLSLVAAIMLHRHKTDREYTEIDKLKAALAGVQPYLPASATIGFAGEPEVETFSQARYLLAPHVLTLDITNRDTTLLVKRSDSKDSTLNSLAANSHIIWQHQD